jgi:hypothetical protein
LARAAGTPDTDEVRQVIPDLGLELSVRACRNRPRDGYEAAATSSTATIESRRQRIYDNARRQLDGRWQRRVS